MAQETEGTLEFAIRYQAEEEVHQTWFRVIGDIPLNDREAPRPVVLLHGGPGATHDYLSSLAALADEGRAVVLYDQLGNGRSTHLPERGGDFWTVDLFVRELHNLVEKLGLARTGYHVLGQSWGGFLAQEFAFTSPNQLRSLVLADTAASFPDFVDECNKLREELPPEVEAVLRRHEDAGTTSDPEYQAACQVFYKRHLCRLEDWPEEVVESFAWMDRDPTVYHTMNGPSEFHVVGSIRDWSSKERLGDIRVPVLLASGRYDEATPALQEALLAGIPDCRWELFDESAHLPHVEEPEKFRSVVQEWFAANE